MAFHLKTYRGAAGVRVRGVDTAMHGHAQREHRDICSSPVLIFLSHSVTTHSHVNMILGK